MQMGSLGLPELLVILLVVLLLFGPKRLPEVARGLGKAVRDFRRGLEQGLDEVAEAPHPDGREPAGTGPRSGLTAGPPGTPEAGNEASEPASVPPPAEGAAGAGGERPNGDDGGQPPARAA